MQKLVFIYNAESGLLSDIKGAMAKILSPGSYDCDLCKITYGVISIKDDWRIYLASLPQEKVFLHKDQLVGDNKKYSSYRLPIILLETEKGITELVSHKDFKTIRTAQALIIAIDKQLI